MLSPAKRKNLSLMEPVNSVSVHVPRGDYVDCCLQGNIATPAFCANAVNAVRERTEDPSFFVFSNDPDWCRGAVGYAGRIEWDTVRPNGTPQKLLDVSRATALGWASKTELEEGIRLTYEDFLHNPIRTER